MAADDRKQQEMKQQIAMYLRKKDYYDILGINKNSTEADIKKAYKKLALRFHPDKNNTEGSKEVFKKVSNAYSNLIDPEKKASYDRYGPQQDREPQYRPQRQYRQGFSQQDQFEEIFRAFFGGAPHHQGFHNNHFQHFTFNMGGGQRAQGNQAQNGSNMIYFLILIFVIYIFPLFFSKQQSLFSTSATNTYRFPMKTSTFQAPYYVREQYFSQNKNAQHQQNRLLIEKEVDRQYYIRLGKECEMQKWTTRSQGAQSAARRKYKQSCAKFETLQQNHQNYVRDLIYGY